MYPKFTKPATYRWSEWQHSPVIVPTIFEFIPLISNWVTYQSTWEMVTNFNILMIHFLDNYIDQYSGSTLTSHLLYCISFLWHRELGSHDLAINRKVCAISLQWSSSMYREGEKYHSVDLYIVNLKPKMWRTSGQYAALWFPRAKCM